MMINKKHNNAIKFKIGLKALLVSSVFLTSFVIHAVEPYTGDIDGADTWGPTNSTNFIDMVSTNLGTVTNGVQMQVDSTTGTPDGAITYVASNPNTNEEININIANADALGQIATITYTFFPAEFPIGVTNPSMTFRDVDDNTSTSGPEDDGGTSDNEFCDRLEFTATDTNGGTIDASNYNFAAGTTGVAGVTSEPFPTATQTGSTYIVEAITSANDTAGNGEIIVTVNADNVDSIVVRYLHCDLATKPDVDRAGAIGVVNGLTGFDLPTTNLTIQKQWVDAAVNDTAVVSTATSASTTVGNLNSTANTSAETDALAVVEVKSGFDYTITEALGGANTGFYDSTLSCTGTGDTDVSNGVLTPATADTDVVCTYLNDGRISDLQVVKTDGETTYTPGEAFSYTVTVSNNGPDAVTNALLSDNVPTWGLGVTWTCAPAVGSLAANCGVTSGSGDLLNQVIASIPNGEAVVYTITGTYSTDMTDYP